MAFIIYADTESLLKKTDTCHSYPEKSSTTKINKHTTSGYSFLHIVYSMPEKTRMTVVGLRIV